MVRYVALVSKARPTVGPVNVPGVRPFCEVAALNGLADRRAWQSHRARIRRIVTGRRFRRVRVALAGSLDVRAERVGGRVELRR